MKNGKINKDPLRKDKDWIRSKRGKANQEEGLNKVWAEEGGGKETRQNTKEKKSGAWRVRFFFTRSKELQKRNEKRKKNAKREVDRPVGPKKKKKELCDFFPMNPIRKRWCYVYRKDQKIVIDQKGRMRGLASEKTYLVTDNHKKRGKQEMGGGDSARCPQKKTGKKKGKLCK